MSQDLGHTTEVKTATIAVLFVFLSLFCAFMDSRLNLNFSFYLKQLRFYLDHPEPLDSAIRNQQTAFFFEK